MTEKLIDVYLTEADPDLWEGSNIPMEDWTKEIRGNRYWSKKNGVATIALAIRTKTLLDQVKQTKPNADGEIESELDDEVKSAEKEASILMRKLTDKNAREMFVSKTNGKS